MRTEEVDDYVVTELSVGQMMPIIEKAASTDPEVRRGFQREIAALSLRDKDGNSVNVDGMPFSTYMKVLPVILKMNGMNAGDDSGNA
jgi:hypothetical protein